MSKPNVEDLYPLTPLQEGMLFHARFAPQSGAHREQAALRVRGPLRPEAYAQAWQRAVDRHPALRTAFVWEKVARPLQVVQRGVVLPVQQHDWRHLAEAERARRVEQLCAAERAVVFDLTRPPLLRLAVARTADDEATVVLSFHHLLLDGWSLALVLDEVVEMHDAICAGRTPDLPARRSYREYVGWLARQDLPAAEAYWRGALKGLQGPTMLGLERPTPATPAGPEDYAREVARVPAEVGLALREEARRHKLTLSTVVQGAWAVLLSRYAATDDVVFGTTVSGRPADLPGVEGMVGLFINTVAVRAAVDPAADTAEWLHAMQDAMAESRLHGHAPLVEVHGWSGVPRHRPLFESLLVYENYPGEGGSARTLEYVDGASPERTSYPLSLVVSPGPEGIELRATFDRRLLDPADVRRVLGHWRELLASMRDGLERPIGELSLLADEERADVLGRWNGAPTPYPRDRTLAELFAAQVAARPGATAVEAEDATLTYADLDARSDALAARLRALGVGPEGRVGIALERSAALVVAVLAAVKTGAAYVPLDPAYPPERIAFMLADAGARVVVSSDALRALVDGAGATVVSVDRADGESDTPADSVDSVDSVASADSAGAFEDGFAAPETVACVVYTSGSTGRPKGIAIPHRAVVRLVRETAHVQVGPADRVAHVCSPSFDVAIAETWGALLNGAALVVFPRHVTLAPATFAAGLRDGRISVLLAPTALFNQLARVQPGAFAGLESVVVGGEAMDPDTTRRVLAAGGPNRLVNGYGPTESCGYSTWHRVDHLAPRAPSIPIGRTIANTTAYVLDDALRPSAPGVPGELYLGSDGLARGYLGRPGFTAERFVPHPFASGERLYRTGDLVRWLADGTLDFIGRMDGQVKLRGFRVETGEVEAALRALPQVRDAVVAVKPDATGERRLVAWIVPASANGAPAADASGGESAKSGVVEAGGSTAGPTSVSGPVDGRAGGSPADGAAADAGSPDGVAADVGVIDGMALREGLRRTLPDWMLPTAYVPIPAVPLTPNGKVDRAALPAVDDAGLGTPYVAPRDDREAAIVEAFRAVLGVEKIGVHDDFFALGGHSLRATQVVSRVRDALGLDVSLPDLFAAPTASALAARLRAAEEEMMALLLEGLDDLSDEEVRAQLAAAEGAADDTAG
ncbi:MAG: Malonyl CoA-acyl carrier protein transacylase [Gemmatimonadetes bacterium]|nr:Malonyl CoA-acyl carrier protein transacylase [Gemmatimonadota bacterium]